MLMRTLLVSSCESPGDLRSELMAVSLDRPTLEFSSPSRECRTNSTSTKPNLGSLYPSTSMPHLVDSSLHSHTHNMNGISRSLGYIVLMRLGTSTE
jgi:hypothetical protein